MASRLPKAQAQASEEAQREHTELGWRLIEWKVAYYKPEKVHRTRKADYEIDDHTYDAHEQRYLTLCRELGVPNTVVHKAYPGFEDVSLEHAMMEVDVKRPSVQLVLRKLGSIKR